MCGCESAESNGIVYIGDRCEPTLLPMNLENLGASQARWPSGRKREPHPTPTTTG